MNTSGRAEIEERPSPAPGVGANSLEQVREILFGPQHREFTRRLARTDIHLAAQAEELRSEARRRLDMLEAYARKSLEGLTAAAESQRSAQVEALDSVARESREAVRSLEQRVTHLEETMAQTQRDFRDQLLEQAKSFLDEVRRAREELGAAIEREILVSWGETPEPAAPAGPAPEDADRREPEERLPRAA